VARVQVKAADVKKSAATWDKVYAHFAAAQKAAEGSKSERTQAREDSRADLIVSPPNPDSTHLMANQVQIIWGNALYDQSQIWAGVGLDGWKVMVEDAQARFLLATCKEADVHDAMRSHIQAADLDLPPDDAPAAAEAEKPLDKKPAAAAAATGADKAEGGAKGLPALKGKKRGKA
jgi:hypothetical protein